MNPFRLGLIILGSLLIPAAEKAVRKAKAKIAADRKAALRDPRNFTVDDLAQLLAAKQREEAEEKSERERVAAARGAVVGYMANYVRAK